MAVGCVDCCNYSLALGETSSVGAKANFSSSHSFLMQSSVLCILFPVNPEFSFKLAFAYLILTPVALPPIHTISKQSQHAHRDGQSNGF